MKKTKVVIPALGIIAFATAASITGTVAWFTASKSVTITAGDFAVVSTKNNLVAELSAGVGTTATSNVITTVAGKKLTDASFNHKDLEFVDPDDNGENVDHVFALDDENLATKLLREGNAIADQAGVYSAFTWNITFKLNMASSAQKVGLYLDLSSENTWAHKKDSVTFAKDHVITENEAGEYHSTAALNDETPKNFAKDHVITAGEAGAYYRADPLDTGRGLRIAFVPTTIPATSFGVAKVWAPHQDDTNAKHIDVSAIEEFDAASTYAVGNVVRQGGQVFKCKTAIETPAAWDATKWEQTAALSLYQTAYNNETYSLTGTTEKDNESTTSNLVLMEKDDVNGAPAAATADANLSTNKNYLGYFGNPGTGEAVELTYTCVVWYEGTDPTIVNTVNTIYETMHMSMEFTTVTLANA